MRFFVCKPENIDNDLNCNSHEFPNHLFYGYINKVFVVIDAVSCVFGQTKKLGVPVWSRDMSTVRGSYARVSDL